MENKNYLTISEFTKIIKQNLESSYPIVFLKGEISNFRASSTGHWYFVLKDEGASIRAIIFKNSQNGINNHLRMSNCTLKDGQEVIVEGRISLYERSGEYSIIVSKLFALGAGDLSIKFEMLKEKLAKEGLFNPAHKKTLPQYPAKVGIITSPTAAALQDILNVLKRRFSSLHIMVFPTSVQGESAKEEIVKAIEYADYHYANSLTHKVDAVILARGGGSIEDLWPFNEEMVANAIYRCQVPIITGIGHEIDFTIADFCSDYRAPTPSAAAEILVKNSEDLLNSIASTKQRMEIAFNNYYDRLKTRLRQLNTERQLLLFERIYQNNLQDYSYLEEKLFNNFNYFKNNIQQKYSMLIQKLDNLSPLKTLKRGYSIVLDKNEQPVTHYQHVNPDDPVTIILNQGQLTAQITEIKDKHRFNK